MTPGLDSVPPDELDAPDPVSVPPDELDAPVLEEVAERYSPPIPQSLEETGLPPSMIQQLILKILYFRGDVLGRDLSSALGLNYSVIEDAMEFLKAQHLVAVRRSLGMGNFSNMYALSESGRGLALTYLEDNQYAGKAPVPVTQYAEAVRAQRLDNDWLTMDILREAYRHMVVNPRVLSQIGPAVNSGKSFLIYGQPGNGKTFLAEALNNIESDPIYIPYAIECQGQIIQMYDPLHHHKIEEEEENPLWMVAQTMQYDARWFRARRPFLTSGGELSLEMLDLCFNGASKVYDAPLQLKANNGIYLVDDFGRQKATPAEVLNRWIVPMEKRVDYFNFRSGGKMAVPFETFLVFSTNLRPEQLGDEAFLRRIQYKMFLRSPDESEFVNIFLRFCDTQNLPLDGPEIVPEFLEKHYHRTGKRFRRCHPRDVISHACDILRFERLPYLLTRDVLDRAFESTFVSDEYED
jgi:predicted ATPase with chaperone activity